MVSSQGFGTERSLVYGGSLSAAIHNLSVERRLQQLDLPDPHGTGSAVERHVELGEIRVDTVLVQQEGDLTPKIPEAAGQGRARRTRRVQAHAPTSRGKRVR